MEFTIEVKDVKPIAQNKCKESTRPDYWLVRATSCETGLQHTQTLLALAGIRLDSKHGEVRTGTQADLRYRRLPVRPQRGQGPTHIGTLVDPKLNIQELITVPYCWVRQLMLLVGLLTAGEKQVHLG